ncbi:MAG: hypothetical protein VYA17_00300 [Pseudomonadota bacterium]|nr:hypothetical protein [Pseudomonadota bacterium]
MVLTIFLAIATGACQPLPLPFQPPAAQKIANSLLTLPNGTGVLVPHVSGMENDSGDRLAGEVVLALRKRNVLAFKVSGNRLNLILRGFATGTPEGKDQTRVIIQWTFSKTRGYSIPTEIISVIVPRSAWNDGTSALLREIATRSADKIANRLLSPTTPKHPSPKWEQALHVWPIDGAPQKAALLLRAELETSLRQRLIKVAPRIGENSLVIAGNVSFTNVKAGKRNIAVHWSLFGEDGRELGVLQQKQRVMDDSLDQEWPKLAREIAAGAAQGVQALLESLPELMPRTSPAQRK